MTPVRPKTDVELAERHKYRLPSGRIATSVTAVTGFADDGGKAMGFAYAAAGLAKQGIWFKDEWDRKRDRGSAVHAHLEAWVQGEDVDAQDDEMPYLDAIQNAWHEYDIRPIASELIVVWEESCPEHGLAFDPECESCQARLGYGGRFDLIAEVTYEGECMNWLLDLKTGKPYGMEHTLQLNAYLFADGIVTYKDGMLATIEPLPFIGRVGALYANEDGSHLLQPYPSGPRWHRGFVELLRAKTTYTELSKILKKEATR